MTALVAVLLASLFGSLHCAGMCGALVSGFFLRSGSAGHGMAPYAAYHGARIGVYR